MEKQNKIKFNKESFQKDMDALLHAQYACNAECADVKQLYNAVSKAVMANLYGDWKNSTTQPIKRCGYFSAEFLIGRAIFANLLNLGILDEVRAALAERKIDINDFEEVEDAALGNGGLGRLAACYLESAATCGIPLDGYGLRYRYGLFKQTFKDGFQTEEGDDWLKWGDPWSVRKEENKVIVHFADRSVLAVPYDMPVIGYQSGVINTLRLWQSEPIEKFDFKTFDDMLGEEKARENFEATKITDVLYPNDNSEEGKLLRLRQQYFMVSASLQDILREQKKQERNLSEFYKYQVIQLNDTHPVLAIPELIRLLEKEGMSFENAFKVVQKVFKFTNHTILSEALEKWQGEWLNKILPEIWEILKKIQSRLEAQQTKPSKEKLFIIKDEVVHMANLAVYVCEKVNGVAAIHTNILKENTFKNWYEIYPQKFVNITNGITPRRWILLNNPKLSAEITKRIGDGWKTDLKKISAIQPYIEEKNFRDAFISIKAENKKKLAAYIQNHEGISLPETFIFDVQIKRLHEYKRQLLNAFSIMYIYEGIKNGKIKDFHPTAFIFGAKAAPGYYNAKAVMKYLNEIAHKVNADKEVEDKLKVVFVQNYNVSYAEKIVCASDVSEQISMAGMEASGTGNMKFMLNGTITLGTMDGANVEICEEAGRENNYIFGATVEEVASIKKEYEPVEILKKDPLLEKIVNELVDGTFDDGGTGMLKALYNSLVIGNEADRYLVLYDFADYMRAKLQLNADYNSEEFITKSLINLASSGKFSSDRSVMEYAEKIWELT